MAYGDEGDNYQLRKCSECTEHSGVMTRLSVHGKILERFDARLYQILIGIILTGMAGTISAGVSIYLATDARIEKQRNGLKQERLYKIDNLSPDIAYLMLEGSNNDISYRLGSEKRFSWTWILRGFPEWAKAQRGGFYIEGIPERPGPD